MAGARGAAGTGSTGGSFSRSRTQGHHPGAGRYGATLTVASDSPRDAGRTRPSAEARILDAAGRLVRRTGVAGVSMGDVAAEAGVSKALVLYHFVDKDGLLAALVEDVGARVIARARDVSRLERAERPLDAYWDWLEHELTEGDVRALVSLTDVDSANTRAALRRVAEERRLHTAAQVQVLFKRLSVGPRMPAGLVAETVLAFVDGLACRAALGAVREPRGAFDVLWLALLTLAE